MMLGKVRKARPVLLGTAVLALGALQSATAQVAQVTYTIADLGTFPGGNLSAATALNSAGQVVGYSYDGTYTGSSPNLHPFWYNGGSLVDLGTLGAGSRAYARAINASSVVVGDADTGLVDTFGNPISHAFLYAGSGLTDLGTLGGTNSYAYGINGASQVVGQAYTMSRKAHAFLYSGGIMQDLTPTSSGQSAALSINDSGVIAGWATNGPGNFRAYVWNGGSVTDLGTLGGSQATANGLNAAGQVVGWSETLPNNNDIYHAFLSSGGVLQDLGTLGGDRSLAYGINAGGQVVGWSDDSAGSFRAFLYSEGTLSDLNSHISSSAGWMLHQATAINDNGQIVGYGAIGSEQHAFLLTAILRQVSGTVTLQGCIPSAIPAQPVIFQFRTPGTTTALFTRTTHLDMSGNFSFSDIPPGTYDVAIKGAKWLQKVVFADTSGGNVTGITATLLAGDVNNNNSVTTSDYLLLKAAFGSQPGDPNWNPAADLNCDGRVTTGDYLLLKANFGRFGDP